MHLHAGQAVVVRDQGAIRHLSESVSTEEITALEMRHLDAISHQRACHILITQSLRLTLTQRLFPHADGRSRIAERIAAGLISRPV